MHQKVEENHAKWFQRACQIAKKLDITVQKPKTSQVQCNCANNPAETVEDHYRRNLTIPLVDHLINELETRFGSGDQENSSTVPICCSLNAAGIKRNMEDVL